MIVAERKYSSELERGSEILGALLPEEGLPLPTENRTIVSRSTEFGIHIIEGVDGVSTVIDQHFPDLKGVFPDTLVLKTCGWDNNPFFMNVGPFGKETLRRETAVALRVKEVPVVLGLGWIQREGENIERMFASEKPGLEPAMVMPVYSEGQDFNRITKMNLDNTQRKEMIEQAITMMFAYKAALNAEEKANYATNTGLKKLILQTLERAYQWRLIQHGTIQSTTATKAYETFLETFREWIAREDVQGQIIKEAEFDRFGDQHGDPRPFDNASVIMTSAERPVTVIRDPVRLYTYDIDGKPGWTNFHLCHDHLQSGLLLIRTLVDSRQRDLFKYGVRFSEKRAEEQGTSILENELQNQLFGLGLAYGALVEIVVRGYANDQGSGPSIEDYWEMIGSLGESNFTAWREYLW